jgi:pSer/pThr/pTyr-binding forkhead associated (FHA) protein
MLELIFLEGAQRGEVIRLTFEKAWFGRQTTCDFVLQGEGISRVHFSIERRGPDYVLIDNKSTNGVFVNRLHTTAVTLRAGYEIMVGSNLMQVREVTGARLAFHFIAERKGVEGASQVIEQPSILLGRKSICQVQLNDPAVAAVHAEIERRSDGVWITDHSSGAGVYVNGTRVVSQQLHHGDTVIIRPF